MPETKKFIFEADVALKESPSSDRSKKEYTSRLNHLAKSGWENRESLKKNWRAVRDHIETLYPDDEKGRQNKRFYIFAIFWAMDADYLKKKNWYWRYLQKIPPITDKVTGGAWVPLKEYREKQKLTVEMTEDE
jgi:hypothetical protein